MNKLTLADIKNLTDEEKLHFINYLRSQIDHMNEMNNFHYELIDTLLTEGRAAAADKIHFNVIKGGKHD